MWRSLQIPRVIILTWSLKRILSNVLGMTKAKLLISNWATMQSSGTGWTFRVSSMSLLKMAGTCLFSLFYQFVSLSWCSCRCSSCCSLFSDLLWLVVKLITKHSNLSWSPKVWCITIQNVNACRQVWYANLIYRQHSQVYKMVQKAFFHLVHIIGMNSIILHDKSGLKQQFEKFHFIC